MLTDTVDTAGRASASRHDDVDIIFKTLFDEGGDTKLSPLHRKALHAVADVVDETVGFVNQEVGGSR